MRSAGHGDEDVIIKIRWRGRAATTEAVDALLQADLKSSRAHGVPMETEDGGSIREWTVFDLVRPTLRN